MEGCFLEDVNIDSKVLKYKLDVRTYTRMILLRLRTRGGRF